MKRRGTFKTVLILAASFIVFLALFVLQDIPNLTGKIISDTYNVNYILSNYNQLEKEYNAHLKDFPSLVREMASNEKVLISVKRLNGTINYILVKTDSDGFISNISFSRTEDYTLVIAANEASLNKIIDSADPLATAVDEINSKGIAYKSNRLATKFKVKIGEIYLKDKFNKMISESKDMRISEQIPSEVPQVAMNLTSKPLDFSKLNKRALEAEGWYEKPLPLTKRIEVNIYRLISKIL